MATILVVDDYTANREFLLSLLGYLGHRMLEAGDGAEALAVVRAERPELVIADLVMPTMDGYEFVRQLRADPILAQTRVMFCTATYLQSEAWALARSCGVEHIITKPADPAVVLTHVAEALALPSSPAQAFSPEEFDREHVRVVTDKLFKQVQALEREVNERKQLEELLWKERDLLEITLSSIGDAVIATDAAGALTFLNPVAEVLTGWPTPEATGRKVDEVFHIIDEETRQPAVDLVDRILREERVRRVEHQSVLLARDGGEIPIAYSRAPIRSKSGHVQGVVIVFRNITEQRQAEAALRRAKEAAEAANRTKSEFLSTVSHELRTPLNVILGYTDILLNDAFARLTPQQQVMMLHRIDQNSRALSELITMMLDLNRLEAGQLPVEVKPVGLKDVIEDVKGEMQELCEQSGLTFEWRIEPELPVIYTDPWKLKVIVKNLVGNAIKFTKEGRVTVEVHTRNDGVEIRVTDTGIGISLEAQAIIFEPFRQVDSSDSRHYGGSGLGLYIVKRLLELLQGTVSVASMEGQGSVFSVWIPMQKPQ